MKSQVPSFSISELSVDMLCCLIDFNLEDVGYEHRKKLTTIVASTIAGMAGIILAGCCIIYKVRGNTAGKITYPHFH